MTSTVKTAAEIPLGNKEFEDIRLRAEERSLLVAKLEDAQRNLTVFDEGRSDTIGIFQKPEA